MTTRGSTGWVLLLMALAVPAYMAYNKVRHLNNDKKSELEGRVNRRLPEGAMFPGGSGADKLKNPIAGAAAAPAELAASSAAAVPPAAPPATAPVQTEAPVAPPPAPAVAQIEPAAPSVSTGPAELPAAPEVVSAPAPIEAPVSSATVLALRDPTLSPYDIYQIQQKELEDRMRREEVQVAVVKPRRRQEPPIESTIALQGIVATPEEGNKAIINGEMVSEGDMVGKVKVLKISQQGVTFLYKHRKFQMSVSR